MRTDFKKMTTLLVPATAMACVITCLGPLGAIADTGGASAPSAPTAKASPARAKIHTNGIATWFGPGFYGQRTACGQTLTPTVIGVANRTLPCGTLVKVAYGGHSLTVPVIDRGPYSHIGADWDLTAGAAQALNITETVRIRTRLVGSAPNTPTLGQPSGSAAPASPSSGALTGGAAPA
jgi:rare lipoprotein A (peptidoglycan hydrolase)